MNEWDKGFDAGMADTAESYYFVFSADDVDSQNYRKGYTDAAAYRRAIRERAAEPRDTKIDDLRGWILEP
jgi:hypothetical protein